MQTPLQEETGGVGPLLTHPDKTTHREQTNKIKQIISHNTAASRRLDLWPTHCWSGVNFPVRAFSTSWLAMPPTAAARGERQPLAQRDTHLTKDGFTFTWPRTDANVQLLLQSIRKNFYGGVLVGMGDEWELTLFLSVSLTSSAIFSRRSESCKQLQGAATRYGMKRRRWENK